MSQTITCNVAGRDVFIVCCRSQATRGSGLPLNRGLCRLCRSRCRASPGEAGSVGRLLMASLGIVLLLSVVMGSYRNLLLVFAICPSLLLKGSWPPLIPDACFLPIGGCRRRCQQTHSSKPPQVWSSHQPALFRTLYLLWLCKEIQDWRDQGCERK